MPGLDRVPAIRLTSMAFFEVSLLSVCQATIPQNRQTAFTHTGTMVDNCINLDDMQKREYSCVANFS